MNGIRFLITEYAKIVVLFCRNEEETAYCHLIANFHWSQGLPLAYNSHHKNNKWDYLLKFQDLEQLKWTIWHSTLAAKISSNQTHSPTDLQGASGQRFIFIYFSCKSLNHQFCQWINHRAWSIKLLAKLFVKLS